MSAKKTAQGIEVRKVPFEFPPDFQPHWHTTDPALSQLINGTSILSAVHGALHHRCDP